MQLCVDAPALQLLAPPNAPREALPARAPASTAAAVAQTNTLRGRLAARAATTVVTSGLPAYLRAVAMSASGPTRALTFVTGSSAC